MPTYAYRCNDCGHQFDAFQKFADDPLTECPECGCSIRRVLQPVGVVFKGSGWYINDSRKQENPPATSKEKDATKDSADKKSTDTPKDTKAPVKSDSASGTVAAD